MPAKLTFLRLAATLPLFLLPTLSGALPQLPSGGHSTGLNPPLVSPLTGMLPAGLAGNHAPVVQDIGSKPLQAPVGEATNPADDKALPIPPPSIPSASDPTAATKNPPVKEPNVAQAPTANVDAVEKTAPTGKAPSVSPESETAVAEKEVPVRTPSTPPAPNPKAAEAAAPVQPQGLAKTAPKDATNAERIKRGLSPKKPKLRAHRTSDRLYPRASPSPQAPTCIPPVGNIRAEYVDENGQTVRGWLGEDLNIFGEYPFVTTRDQALRVQLENCDRTTLFDITTLNGNSTFPYLGLINGFSNDTPNIGPGSFNYIYIGGTSQTASGSTPSIQPNSFTEATDISEYVESAVWSLGGSRGGILTASWINSDSSSQAQVLLFVVRAGTFTITGDAAAFRDAFGAAYPSRFTFVRE